MGEKCSVCGRRDVIRMMIFDDGPWYIHANGRQCIVPRSEVSTGSVQHLGEAKEIEKMLDEEVEKP